MSQVDDLDGGIGTLSDAQALWQSQIWQAEDTSTVDVQWTLSQRVVEVDAVTDCQVEESVDLLVGVVVGNGTSSQWPESSW